MSPDAPARACRQPECRHAVTTAKPCPVHGTATTGYRWGNAGQQTARLNGHQNRLRRDALMRREPLCRLCRQQGLVAAGVIRDHIIPLAEGGTEDVSNEQNLCKPCHDAKTHEESMRGQERNR